MGRDPRIPGETMTVDWMSGMRMRLYTQHRRTVVVCVRELDRARESTYITFILFL